MRISKSILAFGDISNFEFSKVPHQLDFSLMTPNFRRFGGLPRQARLRRNAAGKAGAKRRGLAARFVGRL
jgi:hypothetical protein